jgi:hypothetical protein
MAPSSSSVSTTAIPSTSTFSVPISEKLTKSNYLLWQAQVKPAIRATELEGFLNEKPPAKTLVTKDDKMMCISTTRPTLSGLPMIRRYLDTSSHPSPERLWLLSALVLVRRMHGVNSPSFIPLRHVCVPSIIALHWQRPRRTTSPMLTSTVRCELLLMIWHRLPHHYVTMARCELLLMIWCRHISL